MFCNFPCPPGSFPDATRLKYMSLVVLTFQNAFLILSMRYSRVVVVDSVYYSTTAVVLSESLKVLICLVIIRFQQQDFFHHLHEAIVVKWRDTLKLSVPAIVYMIQNNLQYVAVSNLEAAEFQVSPTPPASAFVVCACRA